MSSAGGRHLCLQTTQEQSTSHCGLPADHPDLLVGFNWSSVAFFPAAVTFSSGDELALVFLQTHPLRPAASGTASGSLMTRISSGAGGASCLGAPVFGPVLSQIFLISLSSYCFLARSFSFSEPNTEILPKINHYCRHQTSNNTLPQIHVGIFQLVE